MNKDELLAKLNTRLARRMGKRIIDVIDAAVIAGVVEQATSAGAGEGIQSNDGQPDAAAFQPIRVSRRVREKSRKRHKGGRVS